jgi:hypothetical protein
VAGVIVKVWLAPEFTVTAPDGEIVPFDPAEAVMVKAAGAKETLTVWLAVTLEKV